MNSNWIDKWTLAIQVGNYEQKMAEWCDTGHMSSGQRSRAIRSVGKIRDKPGNGAGRKKAIKHSCLTHDKTRERESPDVTTIDSSVNKTN